MFGCEPKGECESYHSSGMSVSLRCLVLGKSLTRTNREACTNLLTEGLFNCGSKVRGQFALLTYKPSFTTVTGWVPYLKDFLLSWRSPIPNIRSGMAIGGGLIQTFFLNVHLECLGK